MSKKALANVYKMLDILKTNTDKNHTTSQAKLRELVGEEKANAIFGDKGTFSRRLRELADALNTDENYEIKKEEEWKIVYPGYRKRGKNGQIYYNQPLSYFELSFLLKQIHDSVEFLNKEKEFLKERLKITTSSRYFSEDLVDSQVVIIDTDIKAVGDDMVKKIVTIRNNIIRMKMIEFDVEDNEKAETIRVSPYKIVKRKEYYWLIGNRHAIPREDVQNYVQIHQVVLVLQTCFSFRIGRILMQE